MTKDQALKMNERIAEFVDKIWAEKYWDGPNADKLLPVHLNRFAELIVRDCACVPTDMWGRGELPADQASKIQRRILAQYGVE